MEFAAIKKVQGKGYFLSMKSILLLDLIPLFFNQTLLSVQPS